MKKLLTVILGMAMTLSLTACSSDAESSTGGGQGNTQQQQNSNTSEENQTSQENQVSDEAQGNTASNNSEGGKTLIVYYSATNNTKEVAEYIAAETDGDLFELVPAEPYSSADLDWTDRDSRVSREHNDVTLRVVELEKAVPDNWSDYDTVFIGYPIWWGIAAWPVDGFISANDFTNKTVIPFCTSTSSGLGESGELLAEAAGSGNWLEGERFREHPDEDTVRDWVKGLDL
ncbi:MAG: flavodoxin [[Eubacterium] siraeum]|nr:flavodoxin [[Eubacterium] siraeum]